MSSIKPMLIKNPINLLPKQTIAWDCLEHSSVDELGYGGGAGGGKTEMGCLLAIFLSDVFAGSRGAIGRFELKNLKRTTLTSFFEVAHKLNLKEGKGNDYVYNQQDGFIRFSNGSEILILDTAPSPKDPLYTRFGGLELSWCWIDESNETPYRAIEILSTRVGRRNINPAWESNLKQFFGTYSEKDGWVLKPIFLETFNPEKGHIYQRYWKPFKENNLPKNRAFIRALASDNPHLPDAYIDRIKRSTKATIERLLYGNFDYDDDPQKIFNYDRIMDLFTNTHVPGGKKFITGDIAGKGKDMTVIYVWDGLKVVAMHYESVTDQRLLKQKIQALKDKYQVPTSQILLDYDGIGVGIVDELQCKGFQNNSTAITTRSEEYKGLKANYQNLRSQCWFKLAELVNDAKIAITGVEEHIQTKIVEELDVIKEVNDGLDQKRQIIPKGGVSDQDRVTIKSLLGHSPDFGDGLMMRMYFEIKPVVEPNIIWLDW